MVLRASVLTAAAALLLASLLAALPSRPSAPRAAATPSHEGVDLDCAACHGANPSFPDSLRFLDTRAALTRAVWADSAQVGHHCGSCHLVPDPAQLPRSRWPEAVSYMHKVRAYLAADAGGRDLALPEPLSREAYLDVLHYYLAFSRPDDRLPPDPPLADGLFTPETVGLEVDAIPGAPQVAHVEVTDLDRDGRPDVLVSDFNYRLVSWIARRDSVWEERPLARVPYPGPTEVVDVDGDGHLDVAIAVLGTDVPSDRLGGGVTLLMGRGDLKFSGNTILRDVGRVADVSAGDLDGDGDVDFLVAIFGWIRAGEIGWLEQDDAGAFTYHRISPKAGGVAVTPTDLDGDGALDFVALIAQEHEEVTAFVNDGRGGFTPHILFKAAAPTFGASSMELADLDQDGDTDVLLTNGDAVDLESTMVRPYHGVRWLENRGSLSFAEHPLLSLYGAYQAVPGDFDGDGDLDVAVTSLVNEWSDPTRASLVLLENDGAQHFTARTVARAPTHLITADTADLDGDGRLDVVTGSMHFEPPHDRHGRVTLWHNAMPQR